MHTKFKPWVILLLIASWLPNKVFATAFPPMILAVNYADTTVEQYAKFEAQIDHDAVYENPYDYDELAIGATFTSPDGTSYEVDGFYMQDYSLNLQTGSLTPAGEGEFRVRFAPDAPGVWSFTVSLTDASGTISSDSYTFTCAAASNAHNHGFVRTSATHYLTFDDGSPYIAIGENIAWQNTNPYLNYSDWIDGLSANGANFFRLWHAHWGLGIEWSEGNGFEGLRRYKQTNCYYQDWLFDYCADQGIYIMLALQHHGPVSTQVNPNWHESPYNIVNGGMCAGTHDFFMDDEARADTQNRYRYILARWGYSRSILCWELFNEVHWTDNYELYKEQIAEWHMEMAAFLKATDPQSRIVSTSYGETTDDENVWSDPNFDLTQSHIYLNAPHIERALAAGNKRFLEAFDKPTLNGEFGLGGSSSLANGDPDGIHFHNAMWGSLFSGAMGTAMSWWWDSYIHPQALYYHYNGLTEISSQIPFVQEDMTPVPNTVLDAPGDLQFTPSLGWAVAGDSDIAIAEGGLIDPAAPALSTFLYGAEWNTELRQPPVFTLNTGTPTVFRVQTGDQMGVNPILEITLNGMVVLRDTAMIHTTYEIEIPAGTHNLQVDNVGTDWIMIAAYVFTDLGSGIHAYTLQAANRSVTAGWALNADYNHLFFAANGAPDPTPLAQVLIEGFQPLGTYQVRFYEPLSGALIATEVAAADGSGTLSIDLPSFLWDLVFLVEGEPVANRELASPTPLTLFPNPAAVGEEVHFRSLEGEFQNTKIVLLNAAGLPVYQHSNAGTGQYFTIPQELPAGIYWVHLQEEEKKAVQPLIIID